jgi:hypothetical protein
VKPTVALVGLLTLLASALCLAQETTGDIIGTVSSEDGQRLPAATVTIIDPARGLERSVTSNREGVFRVPALPPAHYELTASLDGFKTLRRELEVALGRTLAADITMAVGAFSDTIEVSGELPQIDPTSTVTGITVNTDELASRIPVSRDVTRLSLLAPGTLPGDQSFETENSWDTFTPGQRLVSYGGASIAENTYLVNGLNITSLSRLMGSSFVPMEFVEQAQIKTGGWEAEFGRATGGVVNLLTKSASNQLRGSASVYWSPEALQEQEPNTLQRDSAGNVSFLDYNEDEERHSVEVNASLGGPVLKDRLFLFAFGRWVDDSFQNIHDLGYGDELWQQENSNLYWGGKLDWQVGPRHSLEGTYLSDQADVDMSLYWFDPDTGSLYDPVYSIRTRGGDNFIVRYTGLLSDNLLLSAQAGRNEFDNSTRSDSDDVCPVAVDSRQGFAIVGCWVEPWAGRWADTRTAYRADIDWLVGDHALRAGADIETNRSAIRESYSGGVYYEYYLNGDEDLPPEYFFFPELPWDQELVYVEHFDSDGAYDAISNAAYVQDSWTMTPNLTLKLGVRWEGFDNKNANGKSILEISDQYAPRLGLVWDPAGDGRSKIYSHIAIYHLPMSTSTSLARGERYYEDRGWYLLEGDVQPNGSPEDLGEELEFRVLHPWGVDDPRAVVDSSIDPMSQRELILGYERMVGENWSVGVRGMAREFNEIIEDVSIDKALYEVYGVEECYALGCWHLPLTNPGTDFSGWYDVDGDGEPDPIAFTAEEMGYPDAERRYYAVELSFARRFGDSWMLQGSYTWSHSYGNYEGLVNSDVGQAWPYFTTTFDVAAAIEHGSGDLPNDRRHNLKVYGAYSWPWRLQAGGFFWYRSGRPLNGFGMHPTDPWARAYAPRSFYNNGEPCPRGCSGTTDDTWGLDLSLGYDFNALGAGWRLRLDAFNLLNNDTVTEFYERAENRNFQPDPNYLEPRHHQHPRSVRFGFGVSF